MKIVLTGKMEKTRNHQTATFERCGIIVQKAVSGKTDFLVTGESPGNNKIEAARMRGVKVVTEHDFWDILDSDYPEYLV